MIVYKIQQNGYFGGTEEIPDNSNGIPLWTTLDPVPELQDGEYAIWLGSSWGIVNNPPPFVDPPVV